MIRRNECREAGNDETKADANGEKAAELDLRLAGTGEQIALQCIPRNPSQLFALTGCFSFLSLRKRRFALVSFTTDRPYRTPCSLSLFSLPFRASDNTLKKHAKRSCVKHCADVHDERFDC